MKKICAYTCITGDYDDLNEIENKEKNVDYLCFTNNKKLKSNTWKIIYIEDEKLDNQRLSRKIKMLSHPYIKDNYDISVWMDASVVFKKSIIDFVNKYLKNNSFAAFKHHSRNCIYEEAKACYKYKKETKENVLKHIDFLEKENYPHNNGLYEMTVFIKKHNDPKVQETMQLWFDTICKHSKRDQLSFMYCVWKTGIKIDNINLNVWDNNWFVCKKHKKNNSIDRYRIYFGDEFNYDFNNDIHGIYKVKENNYSFEVISPCDSKTIIIEACNKAFVEYKNIKISKNKTKKQIYNSIKVNNKDIFYNENGIIKIDGLFKKGEKIKFSIDLNIISNKEKDEYLEKIAIDNIQFNHKIKKLKSDCSSKQEYINNMWDFINSSFACKLVFKVKKKFSKNEYDI